MNDAIRDFHDAQEIPLFERFRHRMLWISEWRCAEFHGRVPQIHRFTGVKWAIHPSLLIVVNVRFVAMVLTDVTSMLVRLKTCTVLSENVPDM